MCLYVTDNTIHRATEDIRCYKIADGNYVEMKSYFQEKKFELGKKYVVEKPERFPTFETGVGSGLSIGWNAFHSFVYKSNALRFANAANNGMCLIVECVIPKGAKYVVGYFSSYGSYCSDRIIYKEIVHDGLKPEEEDVKVILKNDMPIGLIFRKLKKEVLFRDIVEREDWDAAMEYAKKIGKTVPDNTALKKMGKALRYFKPYISAYPLTHIWSSTKLTKNTACALYNFQRIISYENTCGEAFMAVPCSEYKPKIKLLLK